jgi:hypothetical protein
MMIKTMINEMKEDMHKNSMKSKRI